MSYQNCRWKIHCCNSLSYNSWSSNHSWKIHVFHIPIQWHRRRQWHPTPVLLPGKPHGWRSLVGCSPWDRWGLDTTERLHFHFSLSCIGEGNGNPLQCSCLENPRDREPGGLPSMGSHRVEHDWNDLAIVGLQYCISFRWYTAKLFSNTYRYIHSF